MNIMTDVVEQSGGVPTVKFNNKTSIQTIADRVWGRGVQVPADLDKERAVSWVLDYLDDQKEDELVGKTGYQELSMVAGRLAEKIGSSLDTIKNIKNRVMNLDGLIDVKLNELLKYSPYKSDGIQFDDSEYEVFNWKRFTRITPTNIIVGIVNGEINIEGESVTRLNLKKVVSKYTTKLQLDKRASDVDLEDSDKEDLKTVLVKAGALAEEANKYIKMVTTVNGVKNVCTRNINSCKTTNNFAKTCIEIINLLELMVKFDNLIKTHASDSFPDGIETNVKMILDYLIPAQYFAVMCRQTLFNNSIVLDNSVMNSDMKYDFDKDGFRPVDLNMYRHYQISGVLPNYGINYDTFKSTIEMVRKKAERDVKSSEIKRNAAVTTTIRQAVRLVLKDFAEEIKDDVCPGVNVDNCIKLACENTAFNNISREDILFKFILDTTHRGDFVSSLYYKLGSGYMNELAHSERIEESDITRIEVGVLSEMILEFIIDKFCK